MGPRTCDELCSVLCSHMLLADLRYVVISSCDPDCRMDCPMHCNNNITNMYGLNYHEKVTFCLQKNEVKPLLGKPNSKLWSAELRSRCSLKTCEEKESNMIITAGGRGIYTKSCTSTAEFLGV